MVVVVDFIEREYDKLYFVHHYYVPTNHFYFIVKF